MQKNIRFIYLYLFAFVGLLTVVIGSVRMADLAMKVFVFRDSDRYEYAVPVVPEGEGKGNPADEQAMKNQAIREQRRNREREFTGAFAMIVVGLPLYAYHWKTIQSEHRKK